MITKKIQRTSLYPTQELFKKHLEEYVENGSNGYINDIGKHKWDSRFYSEFMPMVSKCNVLFLLIHFCYS